MAEGEREHAIERQVDILARIARLATEDLELGPMLQRVTDALAELFTWEFVALVRVDFEAGQFVCEAVTSSVPTEIVVGYSRPFGTGVVGRVAATAEPVLLDDTTDFPDFIDTLHGARSELCVPIRHRGEVVAVLNLESPRPAAFHGQLALVEAIAGQIAGAIASARHHEQVQRSATAFAALSAISRTALEADELESILERIARFLQRWFDLYLVAIVVADDEAREWTHRAFASREPIEIKPHEAWPTDRGVVGRAIRRAEPQLVLDVGADPDYFAVNDRVVSEFVVPIRWGDRILGALNAESDRPEVFSRETRELLELVAGQVAGAIRFALVHRRLSETKVRLEEANRKFERLSLSDALTGVANRRRFDSALQLEWRRLVRLQRPISLLLLDVDCFKTYNDTLGHLEGDRCLQRIAALLAAGIHRAGDLVARYGGEEFGVLLTDTDEDAARGIAERLRAGLEDRAIPHPASTVGPFVTLSVGVATRLPARDGTHLDLVAAADDALYRAKRGGRNRVEAATVEAGDRDGDRHDESGGSGS